MRIAAGTPLFGMATALALLAGIAACLWLPALPHLSVLLACALAGAAIWFTGDINEGRRPLQHLWRACGRWVTARWPMARSLVPHALVPRSVGQYAWLARGRRIAGALILGFGLAGLHAAYALAHQLPVSMEQQDVSLSGRIIDLPAHEARRTRFQLRVDTSRDLPAALRGRLLQISWYDPYKAQTQTQAPSRRFALQAGSRWQFSLRLRAPRGLRNPGSFDSEKSALAQRITARGYVRDPDGARQLAPAQDMDAWRQRMSARIALAVDGPSARYVQALALGDTRGLDDLDWETLRAAGLIHLVAISGFHVGMVAALFALLASGLWRVFPALAQRLPRPQAAAAAALAGALLYAAAAGFALPTVRTVLMIGVVVVARSMRRPVRVGDGLALAGMAMLLVDPLAVLAAGFWLSFAGVAWLAWCLPDAGRSRIGDFLSAQGVATLGLLPLTVVLFGQASMAGPLANLVAIPWWSFVVVPLSLLGTACEAIHAGWGGWAWRAGAWCFELAWPLFQWMARSRFALWWLPEPAWFALPLAMAGAFWCLLPRGVPGKPLALLLWLPLLWPDRGLPQAGAAELVVLDVGQGLSVLVRTSNHSLLYDMGPAQLDGFDAGERVDVPSLRALGVRALDAAIISHGDNDHAGGFDAVARSNAIPVAFSPEGVGIQGTRPCVAGTQWQWDGVRFRFLHPPRYFPYLDNESSCVLRIETADGRVALLAGDIGAVIERDLVRIEAASLRADVVLIAHHGSDESSDPAFIAATRAGHALVSAGFGNRFGHPRPRVIARWQAAGAQVSSTIDGGALRVALAADGVRVEARRRSHPRLWDAALRQARETDAPPALSYRPD